MDDSELVGGVLIDANDLRAGELTLARLLRSLVVSKQEVIQSGFDPDLVQVLRTKFGRNVDRIDLACSLGAAWVAGRRSVSMQQPWEIVASLPTGTPMPVGLRRTTGETLMGLVSQATKSLRIAAPFIDWSGMSFIADALAAATTRGVKVEVQLPTRSTRAEGALNQLEASVSRGGVIANFAFTKLRYEAPWAHLKVLSSDSSAAYIGSANVTGAGIAGQNLELGVLVRGEAVLAVERILDLFRE